MLMMMLFTQTDLPLPVLPAMSRWGTVSYTHLDVYKRQHRDGTLYFAVENKKGLFKGSGSDDVLREKFAR